MFSYCNFCLSPDHFGLLCTFTLHMNFNFFDFFCENDISSVEYFIYMHYVFSTIKHLNISMKNFTDSIYKYTACGTIWRQLQWTCTLLSSQILQKHVDRRNSAATLRSFYSPISELRCVPKSKFLSPVSYGKKLSVIIGTWRKYLSLGTWLYKQRQNNGKI